MNFETELLLPWFADGLQAFAAADIDRSNMDHIVQMSNLSEYDLGGEGDLFKAPEPIFEEPILELDLVTATIHVAEMATIQNEQLLSEVLYEFEKDLLAQSAIKESQSSDQADQITDAVNPVEDINNLVAEGPLQKSVSSGSLNCALRPDNATSQALDPASEFGLRRAYSEGDIQTLGSVNFNVRNISTGFPTLAISDLRIEDKIEERKQKLSRYRKKRTQRNFGRKIKYACRKALADVQPRIRGRFAKTEGADSSK